MRKKLSGQAKYIKKEFPVITDRDIDTIDIMVKQKIKDCDVPNMFNDVAEYIEKMIKQYYQTENCKKVRRKARKIAQKYLENDRTFKLQESWYGVLAYFLTLVNMVQRVVNLDTEINDIFSLGIYLVAIFVWTIIAKNKYLMGKEVEFFVNQFNSVSASMAIISLVFFYLAVISTSEVYIWIVVIILSAAAIVWLTIDGCNRHKKYLETK